MHTRSIHRSTPGARSGPSRRALGRGLGLASLASLAAAPLALLALPTAAGAQTGGSVSLVAYSTPKPAYTVLAQDFAKTKGGTGVTVSPSFGPSGTQATSVVDGLPADVVNFSLEPDLAKLVKAGLVSSSWDKGATKGMVTDSIVSFIVRPGNPKHITTWADLVKPGVGVITPNVFSSGSAKWNIMAAYGAEIHLGKTPAQAQTYLSQLLHNAVAQPSSASAALQTFLSGQGDVLLDYEDDALYAKSKGEAVDIITPPQTILIENPIAVTKTASSPAKAFVSYLLSPAGQKVWGQQGYRPVLPSVASQFHFPQPKTLFTIGSLGGWTTVNTKFFDPQTGIVAHVEQSLGVSTASG
ncbi:MAG TPA: sulfate ABC transporter substrate-binding protein [Acidimicrobiales bacterium]|nr:sulfate ABC transporter substrate-binding protein [Acidimicrobiales bacterium]